jgi:two-component system sensor histidine kinase SenX3
VITAAGPTLAGVVRIESEVAVGVGAAIAVLLLLLVVWRWRRRRAFARRLSQAALRLEESPGADERSVEKSTRRLERAVDWAALRLTGASATEARLAHAFDAIPQGVVICDEAGEVVFRNHSAEGFVSARHSEALVAAAVEELIASALEGTGDRRSLDLFGPPRRSLSITSQPLDDARRTVGAVVVIDDLTERRRLEAMRRDFVANISHELKTPVGALGLLAETITDEDDPAVARRLAERMLYEATRVGRTIDDLLELSRIEAEEPHPPEPVPVNLIVAEAVERIRPAAEYRGATIEVVEAPRTLTILGDRRQLVSAIHNLLDNATKYSEPGSTVEVLTRLVGGNVEIAVRDHGMGIPARDLERIFERFYRVDRARSRETGGTGLGLAIVRHVAGNHAGECRVESREGEGSRFTLVLPAGPGASLESPQQEAG